MYGAIRTYIFCAGYHVQFIYHLSQSQLIKSRYLGGGGGLQYYNLSAGAWCYGIALGTPHSLLTTFRGLGNSSEMSTGEFVKCIHFFASTHGPCVGNVLVGRRESGLFIPSLGAVGRH